MTVPVAQWIARWTSNPKVPGSNPGRDAFLLLLSTLFRILEALKTRSLIFKVDLPIELKL